MSRLSALWNRFWQDDRGGPTIEYTIIFGPLMFMMFFVFEMAVAYHWALSAQKAVETGARTAAVSAPAVNEITIESGIRARVVNRDLSEDGTLGGPCYLGHCAPMPTVWCSGGTRLAENAGSGMTCDAARFQAIYDSVLAMTYSVAPEDVTIIYEDLDLGFAGEPYVSMVTVSIRARAFPLALGLFGTNTQLPAVSASLVAEDLSD